ncbi:hypothetical protein ACNQGP_01230 [Flavobacterium sp. GT2N3]|uniref:hypothetical protein n=1 Tax=unclassified Flavobacterium TaxID=196869 RepID=UPI003AAAE443
MGFFSFLFGTTKSSEKLPFEGNVRFNRIKSEYQIEIGQELNIWNKPNSQIINLYAKGSVGGSGIIGSTNNKFINTHLENTDYLFVENEVIEIDSNYITLKIKMYVDKGAILDSQKEYEDEWLKKILSKYSPKTNWYLRYYSENKLDKSKLKIKVVEKENVSNYYNKTSDLIWLENLDGEKLEIENSSYTADIIKTLRAVYSEHEIEIKLISKDRNYYTLEIGKKNIT